MEVNIYTETTGPVHTSGKQYGYVLEGAVKGRIETREGFGRTEGTAMKATLQAITKAMDRITGPCMVHIHTPNTFVANMFTYHLTAWAKNGFRNSKGIPVANEKEWKKIWQFIGSHPTKISAGKHIYSGQILDSMKNPAVAVNTTAEPDSRR